MASRRKGRPFFEVVRPLRLELPVREDDLVDITHHELDRKWYRKSIGTKK